VIATPTTTVDVLRGETTDAYGDTVDSDTVALAAIPASIIERSQKVHAPKSGEDRIIRSFKCRVPNGTGLLKGDRIRDRNTSAVYLIDNVYQQANPFWSQDQTADLSLTT
jgi:hypothetical protein